MMLKMYSGSPRLFVVTVIYIPRIYFYCIHSHVQVFPLNSNTVNSNFVITGTFSDVPFVWFLIKIDWLT